MFKLDKKPLVIVTRKLPENIETRMRELFEARLNENDSPFSKNQLESAIAGISGDITAGGGQGSMKDLSI